MKKLLGTVEVMTNRRVTMPSKVLEALGAKEGDFLHFREENGKVYVEMEEG